MYRAMSALLLGTGLAACGGSGAAKGKLVKACLDDGRASEQTCTCMADRFVRELDPKHLEIVVGASEEDGDISVVSSRMSELDLRERARFMSTMTIITTECGMQM